MDFRGKAFFHLDPLSRSLPPLHFFYEHIAPKVLDFEPFGSIFFKEVYQHILALVEMIDYLVIGKIITHFNNIVS